ncbi:MAG TPA: DUF4388 domain-containing protein [Thermoanaerobaculia bacterium]|nr:DUF4388 domain-containing protein [Thermoanaerobaculia bacterium]
MALEGTLKDFSLADIFQLIGLQRKTGVLTLRGKEDTVTVTFLDGKVVAADSLNKRLENRLGNVLVKTGRLTQEQLGQALEIQRETLQRLGFILTHYNIISADSLRSALNLQIVQIIYRLFRWKDGEYHFSQETTIEYDRENVTPITAESILMEGARMIDEWPIIEKRIRSYDMVFRKKLIDQEIVIAQDADEVAFDDSTAMRKKRNPVADKIRISEDDKMIYDMVDGTINVGDIVETSRLPEFDTCKGLYELLTRDLIEEVRDPGMLAAVEETTVDQNAPAEVPPVPLPLVLILGALALLSLVTSTRNPLSTVRLLNGSGVVGDTRKAISLRRIEVISDAVQAYNLANGKLPLKLQDLTPAYVAPHLLSDPWGNAYKYLLRPEKYLVIGFTPDGKPDTDLFLSRPIEGTTPTQPEKPPTGGIVDIP